MTVPAQRGSTAVATGLSSTSPASTQTGDLVLVFTWERATATVPTHTLQGGFVQVLTTDLTEVSENGRLSVAYKVATANGAAGYQAYTSDNGTETWTGLLVFKGAGFNLQAPIFGVDQGFNTTTAAPNPSAVTLPTQGDCCVVAVGAWRFTASTANTVTPPTNYTEVFQVSGSATGDLSVATRDMANGLGASENTAAFGDDSSPGGTAWGLFAIREAIPEIINLDRVTESSNLSVYTSVATYTPTANSLVLVGVTTTLATGAPPAPTSLAGNGLTWELIASHVWDTADPTYRTDVYGALTGSSPSNGSLTVTYGSTVTSCDAPIDEVRYLNLTGVTSAKHAIRQIVESTVDAGADTGGTLTMNTMLTPGSSVWSVFSHETFEATTPGTNFVELRDVNHASPATSVQSQWKLGATTVAAAWTTSSLWGAIALEIYYTPTERYKSWFSNPQGSTTFRAVAYGAGYWVAVGDSGALYYKEGAASGSWTSNAQGSTTFRSVWYGNGYWVAVGDTGTLYYKQGAPTGAWTSNAQGSDDILTVYYASGNWACGGGRYIRYNASVPTGAWSTGLDLGSTSAQNTVRGLAHNGTRWIGVGGAYSVGFLRTSTNLTTWNDRSSFSPQLPYNCVTAGDCFGTAKVYIGTDSLSAGTNGAYINASDSLMETSAFRGFTSGQGEVPWAMCYGAGWFLRVGNNGFLRATTQFTDSTETINMKVYSATGTEDFGGSGTAQGTAHLYGVAYGAVSGTHTWVAVGASGALIYATDYPCGPSIVESAFSAQGTTSPLTPSLGNRYIGSTEYLLCEYHPGNAVAQTEASWIELGSQEIAAETGMKIWWRRVVTGSEPAGTITQTATDHLMCILVQVIDAEFDDPQEFSVSTFTQDTGSNTAVSITGVTTIQDDELVLYLVGTGFDPGSNTDILSGELNAWTNTDLVHVKTYEDWGHTNGNGGGLALMGGRRATAGSAGTATATLVNAAKKCHNVHSHKPKKKPVVITDQPETLLVTTSPNRW